MLARLAALLALLLTLPAALIVGPAGLVLAFLVLLAVLPGVAAFTRAPNGVSEFTEFPDGWIPDPANGTLTSFNPSTGAFTYTPNANYNGSDSFTYQLCDADGDCDTALVTIIITPVDTVPVAVDDVASTIEDTPVSGMVAINDWMPVTAEAPFGGVKGSGMGRETGSEGLSEYLEQKTIYIGGVQM